LLQTAGPWRVLVERCRHESTHGADSGGCTRATAETRAGGFIGLRNRPVPSPEFLEKRIATDVPPLRPCAWAAQTLA
jgi:hypothetical protein